MFPLWYYLAWEGLKEQPCFSFPPLYFYSFMGTICPSDCLLLLCFPPFSRLYGIPCTYTIHGRNRLSPVDAVPLYNMTGSQTPQQCVKSHHIDKPTCCLPLWQKRRPAGFRNFGAQSFALLSYCLRLAHDITAIGPRLATGDVVSIFPDRISTC